MALVSRHCSSCSYQQKARAHKHTLGLCTSRQQQAQQQQWSEWRCEWREAVVQALTCKMPTTIVKR